MISAPERSGEMEEKIGMSGRILNLLYRIEEGVLVSLLMVMIVLAVGQIFMRNIFESGIVWGDPLLRILVLWISLVGGMIAAREDRHINVDILTSYMSKKTRLMVRSFVNVAVGLICTIMVWYGIKFVRMEGVSNNSAFASVPTWICAGIIPFAFMIISVRYIILGIEDMKSLLMLRYDIGED
jgi:TRAP-type C4-dicarboxylate transport system permease small subunit